MDKSAVMFVKSKKEYDNIHENSWCKHVWDLSALENSKPLKFLIIVEETKSLEEFLKDHSQSLLVVPIDFRSYAFMMIADNKSVHLLANLIYSKNHCNYFKAETLNSFDIKSQQWKNKLQNFDHNRNFYGCMLHILVHIDPLFYFDVIKKHPDSFFDFNQKLKSSLFTSKETKFIGLTHDILNTIAQKLNFTPHFQFFNERNVSDLH
ncbi:hypothetical protein PVAND_004035 [Polypedilum vanderplanki]|uniref:Uncharacterized protein n=1 Tax=Polypedilum vanderplanki TaxID=319348 RepID=A0A9J6BXV3_POLVA|nr:hypothetical protein PVAND_004035 [Polypedilum vanderplanki]